MEQVPEYLLNKMRNYIEDTLRLRKGHRKASVSLLQTLAILQLECPYQGLGYLSFNDFLKALNIDLNTNSTGQSTRRFSQPVHYLPADQEISVKLGDRVSWSINGRNEWGTVKWIAVVRRSICAGIEFDRPIGVPLTSNSGSLFESKPGHARILPIKDIVKAVEIDITGEDEGELDGTLVSDVSQPLVSVSPSAPSESESSEVLSPTDAVPVPQMSLPVSPTAVSDSPVSLSSVKSVSAPSVSLSHTAVVANVLAPAPDDEIPNLSVLLPPFEAEPDTPTLLVSMPPAEGEPLNCIPGIARQPIRNFSPMSPISPTPPPTIDSSNPTGLIYSNNIPVQPGEKPLPPILHRGRHVIQYSPFIDRFAYGPWSLLKKKNSNTQNSSGSIAKISLSVGEHENGDLTRDKIQEKLLAATPVTEEGNLNDSDYSSLITFPNLKNGQPDNRELESIQQSNGPTPSQISNLNDNLSKSLDATGTHVSKAMSQKELNGHSEHSYRKPATHTDENNRPSSSDDSILRENESTNKHIFKAGESRSKFFKRKYLNEKLIRSQDKSGTEVVNASPKQGKEQNNEPNLRRILQEAPKYGLSKLKADSEADAMPPNMPRKINRDAGAPQKTFRTVSTSPKPEETIQSTIAMDASLEALLDMVPPDAEESGADSLQRKNARTLTMYAGANAEGASSTISVLQIPLENKSSASKVSTMQIISSTEANNSATSSTNCNLISKSSYTKKKTKVAHIHEKSLPNCSPISSNVQSSLKSMLQKNSTHFDAPQPQIPLTITVNNPGQHKGVGFADNNTQDMNPAIQNGSPASNITHSSLNSVIRDNGLHFAETTDGSQIPNSENNNCSVKQTDTGKIVLNMDDNVQNCSSNGLSFVNRTNANDSRLYYPGEQIPILENNQAAQQQLNNGSVGNPSINMNTAFENGSGTSDTLPSSVNNTNQHNPPPLVDYPRQYISIGNSTIRQLLDYNGMCGNINPNTNSTFQNCPPANNGLSPVKHMQQDNGPRFVNLGSLIPIVGYNHNGQKTVQESIEDTRTQIHNSNPQVVYRSAANALPHQHAHSGSIDHPHVNERYSVEELQQFYQPMNTQMNRAAHSAIPNGYHPSPPSEILPRARYAIYPPISPRDIGRKAPLCTQSGQNVSYSSINGPFIQGALPKYNNIEDMTSQPILSQPQPQSRREVPEKRRMRKQAKPRVLGERTKKMRPSDENIPNPYGEENGMSYISSHYQASGQANDFRSEAENITDNNTGHRPDLTDHPDSYKYKKVYDNRSQKHIMWDNILITSDNVQNELIERRDLSNTVFLECPVEFHEFVNAMRPNDLPQITEIARLKGIQGDNDFIEALLFAMLYFTDMFDSRLLECGEFYRSKVRKESLVYSTLMDDATQRFLRDYIANPLRRYRILQQSKIAVLIKAFTNANPRLYIKLDPSEYERAIVATLFDRVLHLKEFTNFSQCGREPCYVYEIPATTYYKELMCTSVQYLIDSSFYLGNLKLDGIPKPAFILRIPEILWQLPKLKVIVPNITLDITELLHLDREQSTDDNRINGSCKTIMTLWAVICSQFDNYYVYIKSGNQDSDRWLLCRSRSTHSDTLPEIEEMPKNFGECLSRYSYGKSVYNMEETFRTMNCPELSEMLSTVQYCMYYSNYHNHLEKFELAGMANVLYQYGQMGNS